MTQDRDEELRQARETLSELRVLTALREHLQEVGHLRGIQIEGERPVPEMVSELRVMSAVREHVQRTAELRRFGPLEQALEPRGPELSR